MSSILIYGTALLAAASGPVASTVEMFDGVSLQGDLSLHTIGVLEDTRCPDRELCFREEKLIVAAALFDGKRRAGVAVQMGVPTRVPGGWLTLVSTTAKPREYGAIPLSEYGLTYLFEPD
jgi:hypothetical protein